MTPTELIELRAALGWTQDELAKHLGLRHRSQVQHLESGRTEITGPKLRLLEELQKKAKKKKDSC